MRTSTVISEGGLRRREPSMDFQPAAAIIPDGTADAEVLRLAADAGRVLVTRDVRTMWVHFQEFVVRRESPGVILIPSSRSTGAAIEGLLVVWLTWTPEELRNQIRWLP
jgi:predicted nuclease of predicted toxin-antitoxin system